MIRRQRKITPSEYQQPADSDRESWSSQSKEEIKRSLETRQSKTKRVKNYLKKCKNALDSRSNSSEQQINDEENSKTLWYHDNKIDDSKVNDLDDVYEDSQVFLNLNECTSSYQAVISVNKIHLSDNSKIISDNNTKEDSLNVSPLLSEEQKKVECKELENEKSNDCLKEEIKKEKRNDVASLVDKYFGHLYENYEQSKTCLIRQARDLLVCEYHGCLGKFEEEFCIPACQLLQYVKSVNQIGDQNLLGWPLSLGNSGIIIHLGPLDPSLVRTKDCYLCIKNHNYLLELNLIWNRNYQIYSRTLAEIYHNSSVHKLNLKDMMCSNLRSATDLAITTYDDLDGAKLPELLQNLLVSVERAIQRVPLDDLILPCPQCLQYSPLDKQQQQQQQQQSNSKQKQQQNQIQQQTTDEDSILCACQCSCNISEIPAENKNDLTLYISPMFEFAGSIPHIDSDEEDDKESFKPGSFNKKIEIQRPTKITDLPEKLLMSGINLPGTIDCDGRPLILCYAECISRSGLNKYEIAKLLLYYSSISTLEQTEKGFTVFLLAENEPNNKIFETLDKAICLISSTVKISRYLIWKPNSTNKTINILPSHIQTIIISDKTNLFQYIKNEQAPASCGGSSCNHDQLEWVEFFKQLEPFATICKTAGHNLLRTLSQLRNENVPQQITRRFLNHQCRQITKVLENDQVQKLRREGNKTLVNLKERSQWLSSSSDVKRNINFATSSFNALEKVTKRLEQLKAERVERLKELARYKVLQEEIDEVLSWSQKIGEDTINNLLVLLHSIEDVKGVKEVANDFEKFFFNAWRQIEKANDLLEECKNINEQKGQTLKDSSNSLQIQMKSFRERLEETREHLEDCSRCFLLLDSCHDILEDDNKEQEDFYKLALRSGNEKLQQLCKEAKNKMIQQPQIEKEITATSTPKNSQIRRRSVSSLAYIYHCNHHAAGELCNCCESDTENSISYKLKKKYLQTLNFSCNLEKKNNITVTLDGIKEERESIDEILDVEYRSYCDSGLSTTDNSLIGAEDNVCNKKKLQCSCHYFRESCTICSTGSTSSNQDHNENHQDSIIEEGKSNSSEDIEEEGFAEERRQVPPVSANNHLYYHAFNLDLPSDALYSNMDPKTQKTLTYIIREMIETERDYVKSLDYIIINYIPELLREDIPQALRGQRNIVFGNVEKIYEFHSQHFLRELEICENNPLHVGQIFLKHDKRFYLYALYNKNKPKSDSLMSEYGSQFFKSKQVELNDKMDLASYLLKPVQRMGKYALLLQQMMKACPSSSVSQIQEVEDLKQAEEMVRFKLRHGNDLLAMDSIRECDVNLKEQGSLLRQNEFLVWEGRSGKKSLRQVFLFEDLILFSKARRFPDRKNLDLYIYKNSIKMTDIGLTAKIGDSPTKFEIWFRKRKPNDTFTLQSMSEDVKKAWTEELSQLLWKQAIKNRAVRMAEMSSMGIGNKPCLDIRPSADQINDRSISVDQLTRTPRFRNSIGSINVDTCRTTKRPHSVISMSSLSSSSISSGGSGSGGVHNVTDTICDSPKLYHRSATLNSQCSMESGIMADMSVGSDESEQTQTGY